MKRIVILGSTGSIGKSTLDVVRHYPDLFKVVGLSARNNVRLLAQQAKEFRVKDIGIANDNERTKLQELCPSCRIHSGERSYTELCSLDDVDIVVSSISGAEGLMPTYTAIQNGCDIALANKESLVLAGDIIMPLAKRLGCTVTPIDSEHNAIWNLLRTLKPGCVERLTLTASGGPFFKRSLADFRTITVEQALRHPTWDMGAKITIDSATMMNKGLEVIEAHHLFGYAFDKIDVIIHPESVIHSMIKSVDGMFYAQIGPHDMKFPILSALTHDDTVHNRMKPFGIEHLAELGKMTFHKPDHRKFPLLKMAYEVGKAGGILPAVFTASDDVAVQLFLERKIGFTDIYRFIRASINRYSKIVMPQKTGIADIFGIMQEIKERGGKGFRSS
jgi:1-deoxy-D-xylulose-5-phosphate reductoisomerase